MSVARKMVPCQALTIGLMCLLATASYAQDFPEIKLPHSMHVQIAADHVRMGALNTRIYAFRSQQSVDDLAAYFNRQWNGRMTRNRIEPWEILAHRDEGFLVTVQIETSALNESRGFIAVTDAFDALNEERKAPAVDIPMLPKTELLQDLEARDRGRKSRTLMLLSEQSTHQNLEFYRAYFREEGFVPASNQGALVKGSGAGAMILNRGNEQVNLSVAEREGKTLVTIVRVYQ